MHTRPRGYSPHQARRAIVAPTGSLAFGMSREFQAFVEINLGDEIQVFDTEEAALRWLNQ